MSAEKRTENALKRRQIELRRRHRLMRRSAMKRSGRDFFAALRKKIPAGTREDLEWAFGIALGLVFDQGEELIKKTYSSKRLSKKYLARHIALTVDDNEKQLDSYGRADKAGNILLTTLEGMGLGALGIGIPDIILFVAMLLRGIYATAEEYGFDAGSRQEKMYILCLLECAMSSGAAWDEADARADSMVELERIPGRAEIQQQTKNTAAAFATKLLIIKFIQSLPIIGLLGGLGNPIYYRRVINYAEVKYQLRYLNKINKDRED